MPNAEQGKPKVRVLRGTEIGGGGGEDDPICHARRLRDGWTLTAEGVHGRHSYTQWARWVFSLPRVYEKPNGLSGKRRRLLRENLRGIGEDQGDWYALDYDVGDRSLGRCHWADWDRNGDLLVSRHGRLFRATYPYGEEQEQELADFREQMFEPMTPTPAATQW